MHKGLRTQTTENTATRKRRGWRKMDPNTSWMNASACKGLDPNVFFPEQSFGKEPTLDVYDEAKAICDSCRVSHLCLEYALTNNEREGYWNSTPRERRVILRKNKYGK